MRYSKLSLIVFLFSVFANAQDIVNNSFGSGFYNVVAADSSYSMKFATRIQSLYVGEWDVNESDGIHNSSSQFLMKCNGVPIKR